MTRQAEPLRIGVLGAARISKLSIIDPATATGTRLVAVAARVGRTRLIDNALVQTDGGDPTRAPTTTKEP